MIDNEEGAGLNGDRYIDFINVFKVEDYEKNKDFIDSFIDPKKSMKNVFEVDLKPSINIFYGTGKAYFSDKKINKEFSVFSIPGFSFLLLNIKRKFALKISLYHDYSIVEKIYYFENSDIKYMKQCLKELRDMYEFMPTKKIYMLARIDGSLDFMEFDMDRELDSKELENNYNDDFKGFHEKVVLSLCDEKRSGLILMHGDPGTGKSTYIKHLISTIDKNFIYVPKDMLADFAGPSFVSLLDSMEKYIIILEDAEDLIRSRDISGNAFIDSLLNLSDGIIGDIFKLKFIVTFNSEISTIDSALMRKGRMMAKYQFNKLSPEKCEIIYRNKFGKSKKFTEASSLSDVLFSDDKNEFTEVTKKKIGFL